MSQYPFAKPNELTVQVCYSFLPIHTFCLFFKLYCCHFFASDEPDKLYFNILQFIKHLCVFLVEEWKCDALCDPFMIVPGLCVCQSSLYFFQLPNLSTDQFFEPSSVMQMCLSSRAVWLGPEKQVRKFSTIFYYHSLFLLQQFRFFFLVFSSGQSFSHDQVVIFVPGSLYCPVSKSALLCFVLGSQLFCAIVCFYRLVSQESRASAIFEFRSSKLHCFCIVWVVSILQLFNSLENSCFSSNIVLVFMQ